jgi:hypothetical protein
MPSYLFIALFVCMAVNGVITIMMRKQVNGKLPNGERIRMGGRDIFVMALVRKHQELFPGSILPTISQCSAVAIVGVFGVMIYHSMAPK